MFQNQPFVDLYKIQGFLNNSQNSQESACFGVLFKKVAGLLNCSFIKKRLQHRSFTCKFYELFKTPILWRIYEQLVLKHRCIFLITSVFYRTSPLAASDSFRYPACNFIKKESPAKMFFCEFCKVFKEHLGETAYFMYKLQDFNPLAQ